MIKLKKKLNLILVKINWNFNNFYLLFQKSDLKVKIYENSKIFNKFVILPLIDLLEASYQQNSKIILLQWVKKNLLQMWNKVCRK